MTPYFDKSSASHELLKIESELELGKRFSIGGIAHIALFAIIYFATPLKSDYPILTISSGVSLIAVGLFRIWLSRKQQSFYPKLRVQWMILFDAVLLYSSTLWGFLCLLVIHFYGLNSPTTSILFLDLSGVCAAAATALNPCLFRARAFVGITLAIPAIGIFTLNTPLSLAFAAIFFTYGAFLFFQIRGQSAVYWEMLTAKKLSEDQKNDIAESLRAAERAVLTKSQFLANMSHEIRTPMNGIIGMSNLLLDNVSDKEGIERLKIIQNCGKSLLELINDVLDFSKLEVDKLELEKVGLDLHLTVKEIVELFNTRASEKGVVISYKTSPEIPKWIIGDVTRLRQILTNLVSNAIKFTEVGKVEIFSQAVLLENKKWRIQFSVKDSGIGIPKHAQDKLFQSFSQVDASTTRRFGGSGLGLAICKGLCEKMGGTIWVESEEGKGSTFHFTLVGEECMTILSETTNNPLATFDPEMGKVHPLNILIAEDNRTNQLVARGLLGKLGYHADVVFNGKEAVERLNDKSYDLILMDCHMPEMDGFEATEQIKKKYAEKSPRIIALSASTMKEDIDRCYSSGMDGFLGKPLTVSPLVKVLKECKSVSIRRVA